MLGYEWNTDSNNGFRPAGLIDLSSTTLYTKNLLLDYGLSEGVGTATHNLTVFRNPNSGALVFSAGSVMWSWGLDTQHTFYNGTVTAPVSPIVQQSMVNLFADMGIQPQTLAATLAYATQSTDTTAPVSRITSVGSGAGLYRNQAVTIQGTAADAGGQVAMVEISTDGGATWNRASGYTNWTYSWITPAAGTYTIQTRAVDDSANVEKPSDATTVNVSASSTYSLFSSSPGDVNLDQKVSDNIGQVDLRPVELGIEFTPSMDGTVTAVRFYKGVGDNGTHQGALWTASGALLASGTFTNETATGWQTLIFSQPVAVAAGTNYIAGYHSNGNFPLASNYFKSPVSTGPLSTAAIAGGPSLYAYSSTATLPTQNGSGRNYWVDVVFQPPSTNVNYTDPTTGVSGVATASAYADPNVPNLQYSYLWTSGDGVAMSATTPNLFIHGGTGDDAIAVSNGSNVLDGGPGSNFLTGGTGADGGKDQFFLDGRGGQVTYSTIVHFHPGDTATIFGFKAGQSTSSWEASGGVSGYQGATLHSALAGPGTPVNASLTFAGADIADASAHFKFVAGSNAGEPYLLISYV